MQKNPGQDNMQVRQSAHITTNNITVIKLNGLQSLNNIAIPVKVKIMVAIVEIMSILTLIEPCVKNINKYTAAILITRVSAPGSAFLIRL